MAAALVGLASLALVAFWFGPVGALIAALAGFMVLYGVGDDGRRLPALREPPGHLRRLMGGGVEVPGGYWDSNEQGE